MGYCENGALVVPQPLLSARLAAMITTGGELVTPKVHLFTNNLTPSPHTVLGDLTAPTFGGYAAKSITWGSVFNDPDGGVGVSGGAPDWVTTDAVGETIYGWFLTDTTNATLLGIRRLATPQNTGAVGLHVQVDVQYDLPGPVGVIVP